MSTFAWLIVKKKVVAKVVLKDVFKFVKNCEEKKKRFEGIQSYRLIQVACSDSGPITC